MRFVPRPSPLSASARRRFCDSSGAERRASERERVHSVYRSVGTEAQNEEMRERGERGVLQEEGRRGHSSATPSPIENFLP